MKAIIKRIISPLLQKASAEYLKKRRKYSYRGVSVWVEPGVFPPFLTISTKLMLQFVETLSMEGKKLLELGCGCGVISILAAKNGALVTAVDINRAALHALEQNAFDNGVAIDIRYSDLFDSVRGQRFDFIIINPPYYPKTAQTVAEKAWYCGKDFEYFENLFEALPEFVAAETYMILSDDCDVETIKAIARKNGMNFELVQEKKVVTETNYIFQIMH